MTQQWKPGALALVNGRPCIRKDGGWEHGDPRAFAYCDDPGLDVRPLVALDLGDDAGWFVQRLRINGREMGGETLKAMHRIADEIEAQLPPPKPEEPTGLGAVVEDTEGRQWVRTHGVSGACVWHDGSPETARIAYVFINAVKVLSEGVVR